MANRFEQERSQADESNRSRFRNRPSEDEIARRAYELYEQRGKERGHDVDDWLQAERDLHERARSLVAV